MIKVVLIEDDKSYAESLCDAAYAKGIEVKHYQGLEEGMLFLKENHQTYQGLILDGRGWLSEDKPKATDSHIHSAINELSQLQAQGIYIPYVINTGFFEQLAGQIDHLDADIVYDKTKGLDPMFAKLLGLIHNAPLQKLKTKYPEPFQSFGGKYLPSASELKLIQLLTWLEERTYSQNYFNTIRDLVETILTRANQIDSVLFLPSSLLTPIRGGQLNLTACDVYLSGREVDLGKAGLGDGAIKASQAPMTPHVSRIFSSLLSVSQTLSHKYGYPVTFYAFQSSVLALIEILIWFKNHVDQNYPDAT